MKYHPEKSMWVLIHALFYTQQPRKCRIDPTKETHMKEKETVKKSPEEVDTEAYKARLAAAEAKDKTQWLNTTDTLNDCQLFDSASSRTKRQVACKDLPLSY